MATIKVMATGAVESMVRQLGPQYEKQSGHTLDLNFGTAGAIARAASKAAKRPICSCCRRP